MDGGEAEGRGPREAGAWVQKETRPGENKAILLIMRAIIKCLLYSMHYLTERFPQPSVVTWEPRTIKQRAQVTQLGGRM